MPLFPQPFRGPPTIANLISLTNYSPLFLGILQPNYHRRPSSSASFESPLRSPPPRFSPQLLTTDDGLKWTRVSPNRWTQTVDDITNCHADRDRDRDRGPDSGSIFLRLRGKVVEAYGRALDTVLPAGYPHSIVQPNYSRYSLWQFAHNALGSAVSVYPTQCLLLSLGMSSTVAAVSVAATLNWILKDGIGQLGTILFASYFGDKFDDSPKKWRFRSGVLMVGANSLEMCTILAPTMFLPLAALANVGKGASMITTSATRAGIHVGFQARRGNLCDITAKVASQTTIASLVGLSAGLAVSKSVPASVDLAEMLPAWSVYGVLSLAYMWTLWQSLQHTSINSLNVGRLSLLLNRFGRSADLNPLSRPPSSHQPRSPSVPAPLSLSDSASSPPESRAISFSWILTPSSLGRYESCVDFTSLSGPVNKFVARCFRSSTGSTALSAPSTAASESAADHHHHHCIEKCPSPPLRVHYSIPSLLRESRWSSPRTLMRSISRAVSFRGVGSTGGAPDRGVEIHGLNISRAEERDRGLDVMSVPVPVPYCFAFLPVDGRRTSVSILFQRPPQTSERLMTPIRCDSAAVEEDETTASQANPIDRAVWLQAHVHAILYASALESAPPNCEGVGELFERCGDQARDLVQTQQLAALLSDRGWDMDSPCRWALTRPSLYDSTDI